jgi:hypothetical protein
MRDLLGGIIRIFIPYVSQLVRFRAEAFPVFYLLCWTLARLQVQTFGA